MLKKSNRIGNPRLIEQLFRNGQIFKNHFFIFKYQKADSAPSKFAVSVSKKLHKKAVKRNKLRRQIYEAVRVNLPHLKTDIFSLIIARHPAEKISYSEVMESIEQFFKSIKTNAK